MKLRHYIVVSLVFGLLAELACAFVGVLAYLFDSNFLQSIFAFLHAPSAVILSVTGLLPPFTLKTAMSVIGLLFLAQWIALSLLVYVLLRARQAFVASRHQAA